MNKQEIKKRRMDIVKKKKKQENTVLELIKRSRPRPEISKRPAVFENRKAYKRSRDKKVVCE